eukprot:CAMPEP_0184300266 /NCGR_PEP_ID=MMETSP1049-20130417/10712_1 /TAXON_ID=77928 /ORGANISM="Proteomonas sulcata, Strain CCMP704" /LENGTH=323 /DNA_ID=CAMNT_0026610937 /DNA_START=393 /DNA_END=1364 /DNA_ORIENTATION=+
MAKAGAGEFGTDCCPDYGLCPRGMLDIFDRLEEMRQEGDYTYLLTFCAVELTVTEGNVDMLKKTNSTKKDNPLWFTGASGVSLDKTCKPPKLFGMSQIPIGKKEDFLEAFRTIACRNTAGTSMNDHSSRSHCFVFLNLYASSKDSGTIRTSRFQFVDLAGSERLNEAHGSAQSGDMRLWEGMATNFSLTMLSQCVRNLVSCSKSGRKTFSFRGYVGDLVPLLSESLVGSAMTLVVVCISSAVANAGQSVNALEFGEVFSKLTVHPRGVETEKVTTMKRNAEALRDSAEQALKDSNTTKYAVVRDAQIRQAQQVLDILNCLGHL